MKKGLRWGGLATFMLRMMLIASILYVSAAVAIWNYGQTDRAAGETVKADVIVVLGAGVTRFGTPSTAHRNRITHGAALYKQGKAPYVLCTGGYNRTGDPKTEAQVCQDVLLRLNVPLTAILREDVSASTEENAAQARKLMDTQGLKTAIVVSDNYHLFRAEVLFREVGINATVSPAQVTAGPLSSYWAVRGSLREVAGLGWHVVKSVLGLPHTRTPI